MLKRHNRLLVWLFASADVLLTIAALAAAYHTRFFSEAFTRLVPVELGVPPLSDFLNPANALALAGIWLVVFSFNGLYLPRRGKSIVDEFFLLLTSVSLGVMVALMAAYFLRQPEYSRAVIVLFVAYDIVFLAFSRLAIRTLLRVLRQQGFNQRQVLIAGAGRLGRALHERLRNQASLGYQVVGFADDDEALHGTRIDGVPVWGGLREIRDIHKARAFDYLFVALPVDESKRMHEMLLDLQDELIDIKFVPDILQYITLRATVEELDGIPIININHSPMRGWPLIVKRSLDVSVAVAVGVVLAPVLAILAALVRASSPGPVIYRQTRLGLDGKSFVMYKFRTMADEADRERAWTVANDSRVTPVGRFMRKYGLDELPQLLNILNGTMSLVGPRPEQPTFVHEFRQSIPGYMLRHKVRAGVTGWAQVHGLRGDTSIEKRLKFDLYYIDNWSLALDVKILLLTLFRIKLNAH